MSAKIEGFENYTIYENGDIWNDKRKGLLHSYVSNKGYCVVQLYKDGKSCKKLVHRLLGLAFIANPENKPCIDHIDRNKTNNNLCNLRWATIRENNNNIDISKGCIGIHKQKKYIRFSWWKNGICKSKNFKTFEDAKKFQLLRFCFHSWRIQ